MLITIICILIVAALIGIYMAQRVLTGKFAGKVTPVIHGLIAATGVALTIYFAIQQTSRYLWAAVAFFITAAGIGVYMYITSLNGSQVPKGLVFIHILFAVAGIILLSTYTVI